MDCCIFQTSLGSKDGSARKELSTLPDLRHGPDCSKPMKDVSVEETDTNTCIESRSN